MVKQSDAIRLAAWVYAAHPDLFRKLVVKANMAKAGISKTANLKGFGCACKVTSLSSYRARRLGSLGDALDSSQVLDSLSGNPFANTATTTSDVAGALTDTSSSSGGFWSGLGSDLSSLGGDVLTGIGSVGSYLTSGSGLSSLTGLANTYFANQAVQAQANTQQQVLQAQIQRTANGYSPAPVTYQRNSQGQLVPVYQSASGYTPLNSSGIAALSSGMPSWLPWAAAAAVGLILVTKVL